MVQQRVVRCVLNQIDDLIMGVSNIDARGQIIDVLSALRGPDNESEAIKNETTAVIRAVALPRAYSPFVPPDGGSGITSNEHGFTVNFNQKLIGRENFKDMAMNHFGRHIHLAARALGIWRD